MSVAKLIADLRALRDDPRKGPPYDRYMKYLDALVDASTPAAQGGGGLLEELERLQSESSNFAETVVAASEKYNNLRTELTREREQTKILREQLAIERLRDLSVRELRRLSIQEAWNEGWNACQASDVKELQNQARLLTQAGDKAQAEKGEAKLEVIRLQAEVERLRASRPSIDEMADRAGPLPQSQMAGSDPCRACDGIGEVRCMRSGVWTEQCPDCNGTGVRS